jgi:hypothetical protein
MGWVKLFALTGAMVVQGTALAQAQNPQSPPPPLPHVIYGPGDPTTPPSGDTQSPLPHVIYGPGDPTTPPSADTSSPASDAASAGSTGTRCEAFLYLKFGRRTVVCPLDGPSALGAPCACPFPPPPPGVAASPPLVGQVVS